MSRPHDTDRDPVVCTATLQVAGCLMQIQTTQSGAVLLNGDLVEAFQSAPGAVPVPLGRGTPTPPQASEGGDPGFPSSALDGCE
jgi:hypothetical protein